ncbi:hypothetical protein [Candidatus Nitrospira bockiana]
MSKTLMAVMALVLGLTFGSATFVQADEKAPAPATEKKADKAEKKTEKKPEKK